MNPNNVRVYTGSNVFEKKANYEKLRKEDDWK